MLLDASPFSQSDEYYDKYYDLYQAEALSQKFSATGTRLAEYDRTRWQVERSCFGMSETEIDQMIEAILS